VAAAGLVAPGWLAVATPAAVATGDAAAAMALAVKLAGENVRRRTGGPFAAIVVGGDGAVIGAGVNVVEAVCSTIGHAEVMALLAAQGRLGRARLNDGPGGPFTLVASAQPCVMCFGAAYWAGLDALVIAARGEDIDRFSALDDGPQLDDWAEQLAARGVAVTRDVLREESCAVLVAHAAAGA
jgi:tRNA(Arg) A34 adenosine deaminase TadA